MGQKSVAPQVKDPLREMADKIRAKGGVEWRQAVLADHRVEFFRGKDLAAYYRDHSNEMAPYVPKGMSTDEQIAFLAAIMMRRRLFLKVDRVFKKPKPGKKRLAKWPKKLEPLFHDMTFSEDALYAWQYDRPSSPWRFLFAVLLVIVVLLLCLFPLAPQPVKLGVVYLSMTLLIVIFTVIAIRSVIAAVTWISTGRTLWLFPNMLSDDKGITEAFWPVFEVEKEEEGEERNKWVQWGLRIGSAAALTSFSLALYNNAPDKGAALGGARQAHDAILDMLNLHGNRQSIGYNDSSNSTSQKTEL